MTPLARLRSFLTALVRRRRLEADMADEWQFHLDARVDAFVSEGLSREEAERRARREFGDPVRWREDAHHVRGLGWLEDAAADLRYAARTLRQAPAFALTALVTLTLGVGLNTGVFSVANGMLFRAWPLPNPDQVVIVFREAHGRWWSGASPTEYRFLRDQVTTIDLVGIAESVQSLSLDGADGSVPARIVSGNYFDTLRVPVALGRGLRLDDDDLATPAAVAVIGHGLWRDRFGEAEDVLGQTVRLNDVPFEIVGVAAPGATDSPMTRTPAVWVPLAAYPQLMPDREFHREFLTNPDYCCVTLVGRLSDSESRGAAAASLELALARFTSGGATRRVRLTGTAVFDQPWDPQAAPALSMIVAGVLAILLVACANLGNLQLARTMSRRRELAVRAALGASRARIVRQLLAEGLLVATVASVTALVAASILVHGIARLAPQGPVDDLGALVSPDLRVFGFSLLAATAAMLIASLGPVLVGTRRLVVSGPSSDERRVRLRAAFLATQVAISVILLVGAALFARGIARATTLVPEAIDEVVRVQVTGLTGTSQDQQAAWRQLYEALWDRLGPDARQHVAVAHPTWWTSVVADDRTMNAVSVRRVSPEFFRLLRIQLLAGDLFTDTSDPADVLVNESLSRALWPGQPALGRIISAGEMGSPQRELRRVIGVVSDSHWFDATEPGPALFVRDFGVLLVRNEPAIMDAVRGTAAEVMPEARVFFPPARPGNITNYIVASSLAAALGLIALGMATAGTFGVLMYLFTQRTREIAVRVALGARAAHVARLLTSEAFGALAAGAVVGFVISALGAPVLRAYLLGLGPYDLPAYLAAVAVLALAMAAASIAPVRRALAIDPAITLRQE